VRCVAVEPGNEWFVTGSADKTVKVWDLASGTLKITLTGHISSVRGVAVSERSPYLFSVGDDKLVKCWDLEVNKVIRHYHGHLSGVYTCALHPTLDLLFTGGRDSTVRVRSFFFSFFFLTPFFILTGCPGLGHPHQKQCARHDGPHQHGREFGCAGRATTGHLWQVCSSLPRFIF